MFKILFFIIFIVVMPLFLFLYQLMRTGLPTNDNQKDLIAEEDIPLSERLEKVDQELGYPDIKIDRNKLNDIWNTIV